MAWQKQLRGDSLSWLLESDSPGVRYLALRDLVDPSTTELAKARRLAHRQGPISTILAKMNGAGFWSKSGPGYNPKYFSTVWSLILLAQLGAKIEEDDRIQKACTYIVDHALAPAGQFTASGAPSGTADCLQGNLIWTLAELGYEDPRLENAIDWMARTVTGEGIALMTDKKAARRYFAGKCGPIFACGANNKLSCAWGGVKVMLALSNIPRKRQTSVIKRAIKQGVDFFFSVDPAVANYPSGYSANPSGNWWKFGFPVFYVTDLLQNVEALIGLGFGGDKRLKNALDLIRGKQDQDGRWTLDYDYSGKTWVDFGPKKQPNKWVTLRALRVLKAIG
jgi:hypothetical protein